MLNNSILKIYKEDLGVIDKVDDDGVLYILNYNNDSNIDINVVEDEAILKRIRGSIYDSETKELVVSTSCFCDEMTPEEFEEQILSDESIMSEKKLMFRSYEGSLIRVFKYKEKIYISTHKKLDAFNSKWCSTNSFGYLFKHALSRMLFMHGVDVNKYIESLTENYVHTFLLRNSKENRLVCNYPSRDEDTFVYYVGSYEMGKVQFIPSFFSKNSYIPIPYFNDDIKNVPEKVRKMNYKFEQGVLVMFESGRTIKVLNNLYNKYKNVRGNTPNIILRYLELRNNKEEQRILENLFPEYIQEFESINHKLFDVASFITRQYINRFIRKRYSVVPPCQYVITKQLHEWHKQDRDNNIISINKTLSVINEQNTELIYKILGFNLKNTCINNDQ